MTTYIYNALIIEQDSNDDPVNVYTGELSISVTWPLIDLSYASADTEDAAVFGFFRANFRLNGELIPLNEFMNWDTQLEQIAWDDQSAIIFGVSLPGAQVVVQVDGDAIPVTDLASLEAFEAQVAGFSQVTSGDWAPGDPTQYDPGFMLGGLSGLIGIDENDDFVNQMTGSNQGRFRMRDGDDRFTGSDWMEEVYGGAGNDTLNGNDGRDTIYGDEGTDRLFGGNGDDKLYGGDGNDRLDGGANYDEIYGGEGRDTLLGNLGHDELFGEGGNDLLNGGRGSDVLWGQDGNDRLLGDRGNDWLSGGDGKDTLDGGTGNDMLTGGAGADRFVFRAGGRFDSVTDFSVADGDTLHIARALVGGSTSLTNAEVLNSFATDLGSAVRLDFGDGDVLMLLGVATIAELDGSITLF